MAAIEQSWGVPNAGSERTLCIASSLGRSLGNRRAVRVGDAIDLLITLGMHRVLRSTAHRRSVCVVRPRCGPAQALNGELTVYR